MQRCRPSQLLQYTGTLVLGVGDALVGSFHTTSKIFLNIVRLQLPASGWDGIAGWPRVQKRWRGVPHLLCPSFSVHGCCVCADCRSISRYVLHLSCGRTMR